MLVQKMMEIERREEAMKKVEGDISLKLLQTKIDAIDKETDPDGYKQAQKELEVRRAKLQARARFFISEEGGGPGGGSTGGGDAAAAADKFMKLGSMKVIGKRDAGGDGDAVKEAMAAAQRAKACARKLIQLRLRNGQEGTSAGLADPMGAERPRGASLADGPCLIQPA